MVLEVPSPSSNKPGSGGPGVQFPGGRERPVTARLWGSRCPSAPPTGLPVKAGRWPGRGRLPPKSASARVYPEAASSVIGGWRRPSRYRHHHRHHHPQSSPTSELVGVRDALEPPSSLGSGARNSGPQRVSGAGGRARRGRSACELRERRGLA